MVQTDRSAASSQIVRQAASISTKNNEGTGVYASAATKGSRDQAQPNSLAPRMKSLFHGKYTSRAHRLQRLIDEF